MSEIDIFDAETHRQLINGRERTGFINRLHVDFMERTAYIHEIHSSNTSSLEMSEYRGDSYSCELPEVVWESDMALIAGALAPLLLDKRVEAHEIKGLMTNISANLDFYSGYFDGFHDDCATDDEMWAWLKQVRREEDHNSEEGGLMSKIEARSGLYGGRYVWLQEWVEKWMENNY